MAKQIKMLSADGFRAAALYTAARKVYISIPPLDALIGVIPHVYTGQYTPDAPYVPKGLAAESPTPLDEYYADWQRLRLPFPPSPCEIFTLTNNTVVAVARETPTDNCQWVAAFNLTAGDWQLDSFALCDAYGSEWTYGRILYYLEPPQNYQQFGDRIIISPWGNEQYIVEHAIPLATIPSKDGVVVYSGIRVLFTLPVNTVAVSLRLSMAMGNPEGKGGITIK